VRTPLSEARLFLALELPPRARERIVEWRSRAIGDRDDLRLVADRSLHVTLVFLGGQAESAVEAIAAAAFGALEGLRPARLSCSGVKPVPPRRPRLFALDLVDPDGRAAAVQAAAAGALEAGGFFTPERRRFWPHVTFARVKRGSHEVAPIVLPPPPEPFTASTVTLYRSHLSPRGSSYEPLATLRLA
jgi:2'-5' RNA ligase